MLQLVIQSEKACFVGNDSGISEVTLVVGAEITLLMIEGEVAEDPHLGTAASSLQKRERPRREQRLSKVGK